jgi:hypothetical protein
MIQMLKGYSNLESPFKYLYKILLILSLIENKAIIALIIFCSTLAYNCKTKHAVKLMTACYIIYG